MLWDPNAIGEVPGDLTIMVDVLRSKESTVG
jgi:hypothetical protein